METKEAIKIKEREAYVPAKVTIIEMVQENVICQSPESIINPYINGGTY